MIYIVLKIIIVLPHLFITLNLQLNISHNQFSFFTKKSFPNNVYTPSYLQSIDISYNEIPIITQDLTFGTSNVKNLNLSHNYIDEIRPGNVVGT